MFSYRSLVPLIFSLPWLALSLFSSIADASSRLVWSNNGHSYQRFENSLTWLEAKTYCESQGGHLATITSKEENDFIFAQFGGASIQLWLGGTDEGHEGVWTWVNGEPWSYSNWNIGEPNNYQGVNEIYLNMEPNGAWNDHSNYQFWFVCESENSSSRAINLSITTVSPDRYRLLGTLVDANSQPACGLALVSGRCMFSCGPGSPRCEGGTDSLAFGQFDLTDLPTETNGTLNLQTFVAGSAPGLQVVKPDGTVQSVNNTTNPANSHTINTTLSEISPGRYRLLGTLVDANNQPACGLALASGRCMFSCGSGSPRCEGGTSNLPFGQFDLTDLPAEANSTLNLQTFVAGSMPGLNVIEPGNGGNGGGGNGNECNYIITPTSKTFAADSGIDSITVLTQSSCAWTAYSQSDWIMITSGASNTGPGTVTYAVSSNSSFTPRTGTLNIAGQSFTVSQEARDIQCSYTITPTSKTFDYDNGIDSITVFTQSGCTWTAYSQSGWITILSGESGSGPGTVTYVVSSNSSLSSRTGTLNIAGQSFTVLQGGYTGGSHFQ